LTEQKEKSWWYKLFNDLYEVTIWFKKPDGDFEEEVYHLKELKKITSSTLKGIDVNGHYIEIVSTDNFSYFVKKIY